MAMLNTDPNPEWSQGAGSAQPADEAANESAPIETERKKSKKSQGSSNDSAGGLADTAAAKSLKSASRAENGNSKTELVLKKLRLTKGVTIEMLMEVTGWQAHSVRGFLSGIVKKKLALKLVSDIAKDGTRRYRIADSMKDI